ncbi:hypothetical protein F5Y04DRAFT_275811 [Hypomontagnella monticulosa]|nr:hypothetical protein F5Y04DRAFT_275811 [Hypomontagnella monticulosa]
MIVSLLSAIVAVITSPAVLAQTGSFFRPPSSGENGDFSQNWNWTLGETQSIMFTTTYTDYNITLWQEGADSNSGLKGPSIFQTQGGSVTEFDWSVQIYQFDLQTSNVFFLWVMPSNPDDTSSFTSHYFNILKEATSSTSSSTTTTSSTTSGSTSSSTSTTAAASTTPTTTPTQTPEASNALSPGAQAGIGIGASAVGLAALAGAFFWWRKSRPNHQAPGPGPNLDPPVMMAPMPQTIPPKPYGPPVELGGVGWYPGANPEYQPSRNTVELG